MQNLKIGDLVEVRYTSTYKSYIGKQGIVQKIDNELVVVQLTCASYAHWFFKHELERVEK